MLGPMHNAQQQICRKDEKEKNRSAVMAIQSPDLYLTEMLGTLETVESTQTNACEVLKLWCTEERAKIPPQLCERLIK